MPWLRSHRSLLAGGKHAWAIVARKLHKQELANCSRANLQACKTAHLEGNTASWLSHLVGPPQAHYPAAIEAPNAHTAAERVSAGANLLGQKYGTRQWDAATRSQIIRCDIDEAGRRRGFLLPQASVPTEARKSSAAAWNEPRGPIDFGDPTRPLSQAERNYILDAFDGAPGSSQFKFKVLRHLGAHAQDAAFALVEAMLRSGLVSHWLKKALLT